MRLGFAVQVLGQPGLKSSDTRRWQNNPHLSVSLAYLRDVFVYLQRERIRMYRMSSDLAPYLTHPAMPQFHNQIDECADELAALGQIAMEAGIRLSFHPGAYATLNSPDSEIALKAIADLNAQALILEQMGLGPEAVVVTHVGGLYDDRQAAMERFVDRYNHLTQVGRQRLVLENDEHSYTIANAYAVHQQTGIRLVLDQLHHLCNPAPGVTLTQALDLAWSTWPAGQVPKIHFSTPRTAMILVQQKDELGRSKQVLRQPRLGQHADLIDPFAFIDLLSAAPKSRDFDVMLECKAKDVALLRLRRHLERRVPDLVALYSIA